MFFKGTLVSLNASGEAIVPVDGDGFGAFGVCQASLDGRAGKPDENADVEVSFGVFGFTVLGTAPKPRDVLYVVDNQTVSLDSDGGARGVAGICIEYRARNVGNQAFVYVGPQVYMPAAEAALLATVAQGCVPVPLTSFVLSTGAPLVVYADGTDGLEVADSEAMGYRFNDDTTAAIFACVPLPQDLDDAEAIEIHVLASRVGSADTTAVLTVGAFFQIVGAAHTADANAGGNSAAIAAATTVVQELTVTIAAGDVPPAPCAVTISLVPDAALDADDLRIHAVWLEYTRSL